MKNLDFSINFVHSIVLHWVEAQSFVFVFLNERNITWKQFITVAIAVIVYRKTVLFHFFRGVV